MPRLNPASILRHVSNLPSTADEIAARCGSTGNKVRRALDTLQGQRLVLWQSGARFVLATPELLAEQDRTNAEEDAAAEMTASTIEHASVDALRTLVALHREALSDSDVRDTAGYLAAVKPADFTDALRDANLKRLVLHALAGVDETRMEIIVGIVAKLAGMTETELEGVHWRLDQPRYAAFCKAHPLADDEDAADSV